MSDPETVAPLNVRPVIVAPDGRLRELDGSLIPIVPGLEPANVLRGIADVAAGRVRPLREIIEQRDGGQP